MAELRLCGRPASSGFFEGLLYPLPERHAIRQSSDDPVREADELRAAISAAATTLTKLVENSVGQSADMISFQVAMLEDEALSEAAFQAIEANTPADIAWRAAMDKEIQSYASADDEYFRARAADLEDIRDTVLDMLSGGGDLAPVPAGIILVARDLQPSRFLGIDWSQGGAILLSEGSSTSHVAMLARARGIPMIVGLGELPAITMALVDGGAGEVVLAPSSEARERYNVLRKADEKTSANAKAMLYEAAVSKDGESIAIMINVSDPAELDTIKPDICNGIGLVRTEFLFSKKGLPDEETQYRVYRRLLEWAAGRPVTIRTLDAGGDKPIAGLTIDGESNPFLGVRGIRLSLLKPDIFRVQLRALARAAVHGTLKIMAPMITHPAELNLVRQMMREEVETLKAKAVSALIPPIGMMVEVPAAALAIDIFDADFFSIGSNDLTQYVTAAGRDIGAVADLADPMHPAMLRLLKIIADHGKFVGKEVSLCGDAGGDPSVIPALLQSGLRCLSVAPGLVARTKLAISQSMALQEHTV